jgi:uncharacterized membrane protein
MPTPNEELQELRRQVAALTARVHALEQSSVTAGQRRIEAPPAPPIPSTPPPPLPEVRFGSPVVGTPGLPPPRKPSPDLESKIGAQWLNRIGIVAVLIGVSYFLKYAFDNNWIGPSGRVVLGLLAGMAVVLWSEWFRRGGYRIFSYSLKAVGIGVLYLSLWAAFQVYHLVPSSAAFLAMVLVTAFTAILALRQDAEVIAAFAIAGGFSTPLLLSTGQNREIELFSYVALLNLGTVVLIAFRPWKRLLLGSFVATVILYVGWYSEFYTRAQLGRTLAFATIFFAIFCVAPLVSQTKLSSMPQLTGRMSVTLISIALLNAAVYFLQITALLSDFPTKQQQSLLAWAAVGIAAVYLVLSRELRRQVSAKTTDKSELMPLLHIAIAIGFLTIAVPLKLDTHWITIGWLVEAGVLLWIGQRTNTALVRYFGATAVGLGVLRLVFYDNFHTQHLFFNARFATYAVAIAVLAGIVHYANKEPQYGTVARVAGVTLNVLALLCLNYEVADFFRRRLFVDDFAQYRAADWRTTTLVRDFTYSALWMTYGAVLMTVGFWKRTAFLRWQAIILIAVTIGKVFIYDVSQLDRGYRIVSFIILGVLLLAISFVYQRDWLRLTDKGGAANQNLRGNSASA